MKKTMKKALAIVISLTMMLTLVITAFAKDGNKDAKLIKVLRLADGVENPNETFNFKFEGVKTETVEKTVADAVAPTVAIDMTGAAKTANLDDGNSVAKSVNIAGLFTDKETLKQNPGVYKYKVTETKGATEGMTYSEDFFYVYVFINNKGEVVDVTVEDEDGNKNNSNEDPTTDDSQDAYDKDSLKGCSFLNIYEVKDVPVGPVDPTNPDTYQFATSKTVTGEYGSKEAAFPFAITVKGTHDSHAGEAIEAYIYTGKVKGDKVEIVYGTEASFNLKDNQYLVVEDGIYKGTTFEVTEKLADSSVVNKEKYLPSYKIDTAEKVDGNKKGSDLTATGLNVKTIAYTNTADDIESPTGVLIDNMPYVILAVIVAGGIYFYFKRNRKENA